MLPMDLAWRLLKMSEAEMREAGYLDYYSPENIANYYQKEECDMVADYQVICVMRLYQNN